MKFSTVFSWKFSTRFYARRSAASDKGLSANADHALFHRRMTDQVLNLLSEEETVVFMRALDRLTQFFRQECGTHAGTCQNHLQNKEKTS